MSRTLSVVQILLGIIIILTAAGMTADMLSARLGRELRGKGAKPVAQQPLPALIRPDELTSFAAIMTNGLFGKGAQGQLMPIVAAPATSAAATVAVSPSELLLLGTVEGSYRETFALVRHTVRQEERVFRLGDMVFDAGRLAEVGKEKAFIIINGKKVELLTPLTPPATIPAASSAPVLGHGGVSNSGGGNFVIDQRALNSALDNIGQAMTDARLLPSQKDGRVEGFRASEVKPNGVFAMIGIKNGDVLLRLNDFPVDSPDKALQSFIALKGQNRLKLDLVRDGQPTTFNYDIR